MFALKGEQVESLNVFLCPSPAFYLEWISFPSSGVTFYSFFLTCLSDFIGFFLFSVLLVASLDVNLEYFDHLSVGVISYINKGSYKYK